ncbi:MAG: M48 family metalloprotease, partial [Chloroflexota bacterium]
MHTVLGLSSLLLVVVGGYFWLWFLGRRGGRLYPPYRRHIQLLILAAPVVSLAVGIGGLHHFMGRVCFFGAPSWDVALGLALPFGMGVVTLLALGLGLGRLALLHRVTARASVAAGPELRQLAARVAELLGVGEVRVLVCAYGRPLALTWGLRRPTVLLSAWMLERLDRRELEAVLAHELGHVARRDYLT